MSIREQLRGVIRRSRDMGDVEDDNHYAVLDAEKVSSPQRSGASPTGRSLQDLMREQQSQMRQAEDRHRQEYLPMLDEAIRAVGGDPNAPALSGGSGTASYGSTPSRDPIQRERSPSLRQVLAGEAGIPSTNATPRGNSAGTSPRINPILNRSPESSSLNSRSREGSSVSTPTQYHATTTVAVSHSSSTRGRSTPPGQSLAPPTQAMSPGGSPPGGGNRPKSPSVVGSARTAEGSPNISYRSATPPPPPMLNATPPPTPRVVESTSAVAGEGTLRSGDSTLNDPSLLESTQRPGDNAVTATKITTTTSSYSAPMMGSSSSTTSTAIHSISAAPLPPQRATTTTVSSTTSYPLTAARPPTTTTSPTFNRSPRASLSGASGMGSGGVMRPPSSSSRSSSIGGSGISIGGQGPAMSLKDMMADRNNDLANNERRREAEYLPLRDAAFKEIEKLEAEGKWKRS